jgi:hypothetical protein
MVDEVSRGESPVSKATGTNTGERRNPSSPGHVAAIAAQSASCTTPSAARVSTSPGL